MTVVGYLPVESFILYEPVLALPLRIVSLVEPALKSPCDKSIISFPLVFGIQ